MNANAIHFMMRAKGALGPNVLLMKTRTCPDESCRHSTGGVRAARERFFTHYLRKQGQKRKCPVMRRSEQPYEYLQ